jgi:hypothetical protein
MIDNRDWRNVKTDTSLLIFAFLFLQRTFGEEFESARGEE